MNKGKATETTRPQKAKKHLEVVYRPASHLAEVDDSDDTATLMGKAQWVLPKLREWIDSDRQRYLALFISFFVLLY